MEFSDAAGNVNNMGRASEEVLFSQEVRSMGIKGFVVRMLPFIGTFALGLFVASFFVSIVPVSSNSSCHTRRGRYLEMKQLRMENEDLRNENLRLRNEMENFDRSLHDLNKVWDVPAPKRPAAPPRLSR